MSVVDDVELAYGRALRALLKGEAPPTPATLPMAELEERADGGDVEAALLLRGRRALDVLPRRVERVVAAERCPVVLADGSSLSHDDAERLLDKKEERGAHRALRASIDDAWAPFFSIRQLRDHRNNALHAIAPWGPAMPRGEPKGDRSSLATSEIAGPSGERVPPAATVRDVLARFVADTVGARDAARDALASIGGEPLDDPAALARALDLPDGDGAFSDAVTLALIGAARDAAKPAVVVGRFRAPRALAGVVVGGPHGVGSGGDGAHFAWPPCITRYERHARTVEAGVEALARVRGEPGDASGPSVGSFARAIALGASAAPLRRALGYSRSATERAARVAAAVELLRARVDARLALVVDEDVRDALADAWGSDPGVALPAQKTQPPWTAWEDRVAVALARIDAARSALALRDTFDEMFVSRREAWLEEIPADENADRAAAWRQWVGELL